MPTNEPTKVRISPKAIRTEESIMPTGGRTKATVSNAHPKMHNAVAVRSWSTDFFISHRLLSVLMVVLLSADVPQVRTHGLLAVGVVLLCEKGGLVSRDFR